MNLMIKSLLSSLILLTAVPMSQADVLLKDIQDNNTLFTSLQGKWVIFNYWASWCQTCIDEIPEFNRFYQKHKKDGVALFAVNYDTLPLNRQKYLIKKLNILYPALLADPGRELGLGDITGIPTTFIFNPQGELVNTLYGGQDLEALEQAIAAK